MRNYSVLVDLSPLFARRNSQGEASQLQHFFKELSLIPNIKLTGLIFGLNEASALKAFNPMDNNVLQTLAFSNFLLSLQNEIGPIKIARYILPMTGFLVKLWRLPKIIKLIASSQKHSLFEVKEEFKNYLWRIGFDKIGGDLRENILKNKFVFSLFNQFIFDKKIQGHAPKMSLNTVNYDFVIFNSAIKQLPNVFEKTIALRFSEISGGNYYNYLTQRWREHHGA